MREDSRILRGASKVLDEHHSRTPTARVIGILHPLETLREVEANGTLVPHGRDGLDPLEACGARVVSSGSWENHFLRRAYSRAVWPETRGVSTMDRMVTVRISE